MKDFRSQEIAIVLQVVVAVSVNAATIRTMENESLLDQAKQ
jgi:hypothetical protein